MSKFTIKENGILDPEGKYNNPLTGNKYTKNYTRISLNKDPKGWSLLRAYHDKFEILKKIHSKSILLVSLPTGTGKTVIIPRLLFHYFGYEKKIIVTTPRQQTTEKAAIFAAECYDVPLFEMDENGSYLRNSNIAKDSENRYPTGNKIVGYRHGDSKDFYDKENTKLLFATDGTVKQLILAGDKDLDDYAGIVIDEVHERNINIDIVIALVMDILNRRKDFKIIFMSATMDLSVFINYFQKLGQINNYNIYTAPEVKTTYNIDYVNSPKPLIKNANQLLTILYKKIVDIMQELEKTQQKGDILIFVTSDTEINKLKKLINKNMHIFSESNKPYAINLSSYSTPNELGLATQKNSLNNVLPTRDAPKGYSRKIIIATPMAESSITFEDPLIYVLDTGIAYTKTYDAEKYSDIVGKNYVSRSNIEQRCGRTGRNCDGTCIQLYTAQEYKDLKQYTVPEIIRNDITVDLLNIMILEMNKQNVIKALNFIKNMIEPIDNFKPLLKVAVTNIKEMDFVDKDLNLTYLGKLCIEFNKFDIKIGKLIIGGYYLNCIEWCIKLGAILNSVSNFEKIFIQLNDEEKKDTSILKKYEDNIKRFIKPEGDHISLLFIYELFLQNNSSQEYADTNGLSFNILLDIKKSHNELLEIVYKPNSKKRNTMLDKFKNILQFRENPDNNYNAYGGNLNISHNNKSHNNKISINNGHKSRKTNKKFFQNIKSNFNLSNKYIKNGGGIFNQSSTYSKSKTKRNRRNNISSNKQKLNKTYNKIDLGLTGGSIDDITTKRRRRYMELFTLANFQDRNKKIVFSKTFSIDDIYTRIIAALYYGFSTNIACYSGINKDYYVKFSNIKGKLTSVQSKSSFDYIPPKKIADWVIYNKFVVTKDFGKVESTGTLSLISTLSEKHLQYFFDLKEIQQKVMLDVI